MNSNNTKIKLKLHCINNFLNKYLHILYMRYDNLKEHHTSEGSFTKREATKKQGNLQDKLLSLLFLSHFIDSKRHEDLRWACLLFVGWFVRVSNPKPAAVWVVV